MQPRVDEPSTVVQAAERDARAVGHRQRRRWRLWLPLAALLVFEPACATVPPPPPRMVWVAPGVWVIDRYDYPLYYYDGFYWYRAHGYWYRSHYWNHGFEHWGQPGVPYRLRALPHARYEHRGPPPGPYRAPPPRRAQPRLERRHRR